VGVQVRCAALAILTTSMSVGCGGNADGSPRDLEDADATVAIDDTDAGHAADASHVADASHAADAAHVEADAARDAGGDALSAHDAESETSAGQPMRSAGCGKAASGSGTFARHDLHVGDRDRTYYVRVPDGYDKQRAYSAVFRWH